MSPGTPAERAKQYRDRQRGAQPRAHQPCGTVAAARRHQRAGEPMCEACRVAWNAHQREMYRQRS